MTRPNRMSIAVPGTACPVSHGCRATGSAAGRCVFWRLWRREHMHRPRVAILLAGSIRRTSAFEAAREGLGLPVLCLPVGRRGLLMDAWIEALAGIDDLLE